MSELEVMVMYRPCGPKEFQLVSESGYRYWPPRLPDQPIFYPVTNEKYAKEINKWNVEQSGRGYVTKFFVKREFIEKYPIQQVGANYHTEWWIPSDDLEKLNQNIVGKIEVIYEETKE